MKTTRVLLFISCNLLLQCITARSKYNEDGEDNPYEFQFRVDGQQHRHEKKDANGIVQGEFGFITADGIYHVTVYATDENGSFKILSMRNIRVSGPLDEPNARLPDTSQFGKDISKPALPAPNPLSIDVQTSPVETFTSRPNQFTTQPTIKPACAGCGYVTQKTPHADKLPFQTPAGTGSANENRNQHENQGFNGNKQPPSSPNYLGNEKDRFTGNIGDRFPNNNQNRFPNNNQGNAGNNQSPTSPNYQGNEKDRFSGNNEDRFPGNNQNRFPNNNQAFDGKPLVKIESNLQGTQPATTQIAQNTPNKFSDDTLPTYHVIPNLPTNQNQDNNQNSKSKPLNPENYQVKLHLGNKAIATDTIQNIPTIEPTHHDTSNTLPPLIGTPHHNLNTSPYLDENIHHNTNRETTTEQTGYSAILSTFPQTQNLNPPIGTLEGHSSDPNSHDLAYKQNVSTDENNNNNYRGNFPINLTRNSGQANSGKIFEKTFAAYNRNQERHNIHLSNINNNYNDNNKNQLQGPETNYGNTNDDNTFNTANVNPLNLNSNDNDNNNYRNHYDPKVVDHYSGPVIDTNDETRITQENIGNSYSPTFKTEKDKPYQSSETPIINHSSYKPINIGDISIDSSIRTINPKDSQSLKNIPLNVQNNRPILTSTNDQVSEVIQDHSFNKSKSAISTTPLNQVDYSFGIENSQTSTSKTVQFLDNRQANQQIQQSTSQYDNPSSSYNDNTNSGLYNNNKHTQSISNKHDIKKHPSEFIKNSQNSQHVTPNKIPDNIVTTIGNNQDSTYLVFTTPTPNHLTHNNDIKTIIPSSHANHFTATLRSDQQPKYSTDNTNLGSTNLSNPTNSQSHHINVLNAFNNVKQNSNALNTGLETITSRLNQANTQPIATNTPIINTSFSSGIIPSKNPPTGGNIADFVNPLSLPNSVTDRPPNGISVDKGFIMVPNNPPIPIQDKYPNMVDGLPDGITKDDITGILYKFNYTVGFHGHYEKGYKSGAKVGGYFVTDRDGVSRIVTYVADENGYRPKVKLVRLDLNSELVPKEGTEKTFGLKSFEFIWYPLN